MGLVPAAPGLSADAVTPAVPSGARVHDERGHVRHCPPGSHWQYTPGMSLTL